MLGAPGHAGVPAPRVLGMLGCFWLGHLIRVLFVNIVRLSSIVSEMFLLLDPFSYDVDRDELFALRGA